MRLHCLLPVKFVALLITIAIGSSLAAKDSPRVWSDASGSFSATAEFIRLDADRVFLKKTNGVTISVPIKLLSQSDQEFLKSIEKPALPEPSVKRHVVQKPSVAPKFSTASYGNASEQNPSAEQVAKNTSDIWDLVKSLASESDEMKQAELLNQISNKWAKQPNPELETLFKDCCSSKTAALRIVGLKGLGHNAPESGFEHIVEAIDDQDVNVRFAALEFLSQIKDPRAVRPLLERIKSVDSKHVTAILVRYGSDIEAQILPLIHDPSESTRQIACTLLGRIGTEQSLPSLKRMILKEESLRVRLYASDAIDTIQRRTKLNDLLSSR